MVCFFNKTGRSVVTISGENKTVDYITCKVLVSFQKDNYAYIPLFNAIVSLDFSRLALLSFIDNLKKMYRFEKYICGFSDIEKSFEVSLKMLKETGHIQCDCIVGNGSYGTLSFDFCFDQTMIPDLIAGFECLL